MRLYLAKLVYTKNTVDNIDTRLYLKTVKRSLQCTKTLIIKITLSKLCSTGNLIKYVFYYLSYPRFYTV